MAISEGSLAGYPASPATMDQVRADRIALIYWQSFPAAFMSLGGAILLSTLLWSAADHGAIVTWLAVLAVTSAARVGLFLSYRRKAPKGLEHLAWERPYYLTLMASTLVWGLGVPWVMPRDSLLHQAMTLLILVGMAGGALSVYSAIRWVVIATILLLLVPATVEVMAVGGQPGVLMGAAITLFCLSALRATRVLSNALQGNFELTYALREAKENAERMASTDLLTGLINRRAFVEQAGAPFHYCRRSGRPVAAIVLDLDHFKQINDTRGHAVGDLAIQHAARLITASLRRSDLSCRWGGEEFVILLPDTSLEEAAGVAEKLRVAIESTPVPVPSGDLPMTTSLGVAEGHRDLESLIDRADAALYRAKREGRNRVARDGP